MEFIGAEHVCAHLKCMRILLSSSFHWQMCPGHRDGIFVADYDSAKGIVMSDSGHIMLVYSVSLACIVCLTKFEYTTGMTCLCLMQSACQK
jgi:hypothetical protein